MNLGGWQIAIEGLPMWSSMYALLGRVTRCLDSRGKINKAKYAAKRHTVRTALMSSDHIDMQKSSDLHLTTFVLLSIKDSRRIDGKSWLGITAINRIRRCVLQQENIIICVNFTNYMLCASSDCQAHKQPRRNMATSNEKNMVISRHKLVRKDMKRRA